MAIRETDAVGRLGPESLAFLFPETPKSEGIRAAERLRALVGATSVVSADLANEPLAVTISLGVAALPGDAMNAEGLLREAETALAVARRRTTNSVAPH